MTELPNPQKALQLAFDKDAPGGPALRGIGVTGAAGPQGETGPAGGAQGDTGVQGTTGTQGVQGDTGTQGTQGTQGATGAGVQGATGTQGIQGSTGLVGETGVGAQGSTGIQGIQGQTGAQGAVTPSASLPLVQARRTTDLTLTTSWADVELDTTDIETEPTKVEHDNTNTDRITCKATDVFLVRVSVECSPGSATAQNFQVRVRVNDTTVVTDSTKNLAVANSVSGADAVLEHLFAVSLTANDFLTVQTQIDDVTGAPVLSNVSIVVTQHSALQGETGVQGQTGVQGLQGDTGVQGIQGDTGVQGIQGATGLQGAQGQTGVQGVQGSTGAGIQGDTGVQGAQGDTGIQGVQGETGVQGIQGDQGDTGVQGTQGETGVQGIQGTQGDTGVQGQTGIQGATGVASAQNTLDEAYDEGGAGAGRSITADAGAVQITSSANTLLDLDVDGAQTAIDIDRTATGTGTVVDIENSGTGRSIRIQQNSTAAGSPAIEVTTTSTNGYGTYIHSSNTASIKDLVRINKFGTGSSNNALTVINSGSGNVIDLTGGTGKDIDGHNSNWYAQPNGIIKVGTFTTAGRPAAGTAGRIAFDTDLGKLIVDNGSAWEVVTSV